MKKKNKILIVEDEVLSAMFLEAKLKMYNYNIVSVVSSGEDAVFIALKEKPEIILMDIRLAGKMDGIEAAGKINAEYNPRIIFMTGYLSEEINNRIVKNKNNAVIEKPLRINEILQVISPECIQNE
jgi:DNA-binding response OmpR family regulator